MAHRPAERQNSLSFPPRWGGARKGAGRKPGAQPKVSRRKQAVVDPQSPQHITIRLAEHRLRTTPVHRALRLVLDALRESLTDFRVIAYSLQQDHLHLIVEADGENAFRFGMRALAIRLGKQLNQVLLRSGRLFADRHHRRELRTPLEVREAYAYVLLNHKRHLAKRGRPLVAHGIDGFSSAGWFDGFSEPAVRDPEPPVISPAKTWLARIGWRKHGLISPQEVPGIRS